MQAKFQDKVVVPKRIHKMSFYNFPEHIFSSISIIQSFEGFTPNSMISEVLLFLLFLFYFVSVYNAKRTLSYCMLRCIYMYK
jgi:hypothetical protein